MTEKTDERLQIKDGQVVGFTFDVPNYEKDLQLFGNKIESLIFEAKELAEKYPEESICQPDETNIENIIAVLKVAKHLCSTGAFYAKVKAMHEIIYRTGKSSNADE